MVRTLMFAAIANRRQISAARSCRRSVTRKRNRTPVMIRLRLQMLATAILDRLLHHATTINIKGESFRLKEKKKAGLIGHPTKPQEAKP